MCRLNGAVFFVVSKTGSKMTLYRRPFRSTYEVFANGPVVVELANGQVHSLTAWPHELRTAKLLETAQSSDRFSGSPTAQFAPFRRIDIARQR